MIDAFEDDNSGRISDEWKVLAFMPRRGADLPSGQSTKMKKSDTNDYDWVSKSFLFHWSCLISLFSISSFNNYKNTLKECAILLKGDETDTASKMGRELAASWTNFVKECPKFNRDIPYVF